MSRRAPSCVRASSSRGRSLAIAVATALSVAAGFPTLASAQPASAPAETDRARDLHRQGDAAFRAGKFEEARTAYLAAWALKKHWQIAANLGDTELRTKRYRDAAEHLTWALRDGRGQMPADLAAATEKALEEAKARVGVAQVEVTPAGADVSVDGVVIGQSPLADPVFLEPGPHVVEAKKVGFLAKREEVMAVAGQPVPVRVELVAEGVVSPDPPTKVVPPVTAPPEEREGGGKSVPLLLGGAVLGSVGVGVGIGLLVASGGAASDRDAIRAQIGGDAPCGDGTPFQTECAEIASLDGDASTLGVVGAVSIGVGASLGVATLIYALWPENEVGAAASKLRLDLAPGIGAASFRTTF